MTNYVLEGPVLAPVVMFASSLGTTLEMWDAQAEAFTDEFRVLRYDHRGHGDSPAPPGPYTVGDLADDVLALLDELGIESVTFVGLSLGGAVGMTLALRAPERIERLALCCTSRQFGPPETWAERAATVRAEGVEAVADAALRALAHAGGARRRCASGCARSCSRRRPRATPRAPRRSAATTCAGGSARSACRCWPSPATAIPPRRPRSSRRSPRRSPARGCT